MSRRRRTGIITFCLLGLALLVWLDNSPMGCRWQDPPKSEAQAIAYDLEKYHGKTFAVVNAVDGDTLDIDASDGPHEPTRVRLLGIDAPEAGGEQSSAMVFGPEAAECARELTSGKSVVVYLDTPNPTRDKYGRLLAYVQLPDGRFLNEVLLTEGYAYADLRFSHSLFNKYQQLEAAARRSKKGLWQNVTRAQLPAWLQEKEPRLLSTRINTD